MRRWLDKLNIYYKCSSLSAVFLILAILSIAIFHFLNLNEYPLGYILGISYGMIVFIINGYLDDKRKDTYKWAIVLSILRYFIFAVILVLIGLLYYLWGINIFNLFTVVSGYGTVIIIFVITYLLDNKKEGN